jgi:hypothetical protein
MKYSARGWYISVGVAALIGTLFLGEAIYFSSTNRYNSSFGLFLFGAVLLYGAAAIAFYRGREAEHKEKNDKK